MHIAKNFSLKERNKLVRNFSIRNEESPSELSIRKSKSNKQHYLKPASKNKELFKTYFACSFSAIRKKELNRIDEDE
jgi:hypothetical protein